jgi:hypothetical protein
MLFLLEQGMSLHESGLDPRQLVRWQKWVYKLSSAYGELRNVSYKIIAVYLKEPNGE